jgi:hypothetical protein
MLFQGFPIAQRDVLRNGLASDCSRAGSKGFQQYEDGGVVRRNISVGRHCFGAGDGRGSVRPHDRDNIHIAKAVKSDLGISEQY